MDVKLIIIVLCVVVAIGLLVVFLVFGRGETNFTMDIGGASPRAAGGSDTSSEKTVSGRLIGLAVGAAGIFAVLIARLWTMQLVSADEYAAEAESNRTRTVTTAAPRGRILDRNGVEIVANRPSLIVVSDSDVVNDDIEVQLVANLTGMPFQAVRRKIQDTSAGAQSKRTISVDVSRRVVAFIAEHPGVFDGIEVVERSQRSYPLGSLAAHVVGYTGSVSSDQLASNDSDETGITYESGDIVGQTGVESTYESVLQGVKGEQTVYVDASGNVLDTSTTIDPQSGSDVVLTIDAKIQSVAEQSLVTRMQEIRKTGYNATGACVVCVDCTNGEVIAMASAPTYNPNVFVGGISTADWDALSSESANYPLMNRAIAGQYPSGSTIKALTSFAALDHGIADTSSSWYCTGYWTWSGNESDAYGWHCWYKSGHGTMNFVTGITNSCDVVFYSIGKGFYYSDTQEGMQETFRRYGLGSVTGIDLPGEMGGRVPDAEWKWNYFTSSSDEDRAWQGGDNCNLAIGQGDLLVTCLQMVDAYCGIANNGTIWRPHVLKGVKSRTGEGSVIDYKSEVIYEPTEDAAYHDTVCEGLHGVVYEEAESQTVHWTSLSVDVAGKTGTAQQNKDQPVGWFIGYGPTDNPKYVIGANVDEVLSGATSAMYIVRDVFGAIYGEPDTATSDSDIVD